MYTICKTFELPNRTLEAGVYDSSDRKISTIHNSTSDRTLKAPDTCVAACMITYRTCVAVAFASITVLYYTMLYYNVR